MTAPAQFYIYIIKKPIKPKTSKMKKVLRFAMVAFGFLAMANVAMADPDDNYAPNMTLTDIHGVSHDMYADLDAGKTVILDFFATWCQPCINSLPVLDDIWAAHGPDGDDTYRIYSLEMDNTTSNEQAFENQYNVPNPIFDNGHTVASTWNISAYPTFITVCPNRSYVSYTNQLSSTGQVTVSNCPAASSSNDATLFPNYLQYSGCNGGALGLDIRLQNMGTSALMNADIEASVNGNVVGSTSWSGNLSTYAVEWVSLGSFVPTGNDPVVFTITTPDDNASNNTRNEPVVVSSTEAASTSVITRILTDNYPGETTWELTDASDGSLIADGGPYSGQNTLYEETHTLDNNTCFVFTIYDSYGDGICCDFGTGNYEVESDGNVIISGGAFADVEVSPFLVNEAVGIDENALASSLSIFPNPTNNNATVSFTLADAQEVTIEVFNLLGSVVISNNLQRVAAGQHLEVLDFNSLNAGIYYVNITAGEMVATQKLTVNK